MRKPSLADEMAAIVGDGSSIKSRVLGEWAWSRSNRIIAELRIAEQAKQMVDYDMKAAIRAGKKAEEDARIVRIVREPTDEQAAFVSEQIGFDIVGTGSTPASQYAEAYAQVGREIFAAIRTLANETGEHDE